MFYEYAVEPRAIGSSWEAFRYIIEKFGFDQGRLISQFPKQWFREVYDATAGLPPVQKKRIEEALNQAKKNKVIATGRLYNPAAGNWLHNALTEHRRSLFHAIIAGENPTGDRAVLLADDLDEQQPLMNVPRSCAIRRDAASLSAAMKEMLRFSSRILIVDPFYDPFSQKYKSTVRECLRMVSGLNPGASVEIHYRYHDNKPANDILEREAARLFPGVIPQNIKVSIFCWRQRHGGEDFHARYLLTEMGGIAVDAGFSDEGNQQTTDMHLMGYELSQQKLIEFARNATLYELVEPVIRVSSDGKAERL